MEDWEKELNGRMQMVYGQFSESKRRLDYFLMGICVAGIGFAINLGIQQPLGYEHIPWGEPSRDFRRHFILRERGKDANDEVFPRGPRAGCPHGGGAYGGPRFPMGSHMLHRRQDWVHT